MSDLVPVEVETSSIKLDAASTAKMSEWEVESLRIAVANVNNNLIVEGRTIVEIAKDLYNIRTNAGTKRWKALLNSGVIACTPKKASDLATAYDKWLIKGGVDPAFLAQCSARSIAALANTTEANRQKVMKMFQSAGASENITEAKVRAITNPKKATAKKTVAADNSVEAQLERQKKANVELMKQNAELKKENIGLRKIIGEAAVELDKKAGVAV
tara:strand:- start:885 stop:1529 length:645 start_codon:yes stop_codon:yes gene_type:complete